MKKGNYPAAPCIYTNTKLSLQSIATPFRYHL